MAPVVRISDAVFRRLQRYGEALVDTPSSVIERVLDMLEAHEIFKGAIKQSSGLKELDSPGHTQPLDQEQNLFLAPASGENLDKTVRRGIALDAVRDVLSDREANAIEDMLEGSSEFRCWAMTESSRAVYSPMRPNDLVLFTERGSGRFGYRAQVVGKIESQRLGEKLWRIVPNRPWKLIYLLKDVRKLDASKAQLLQELGYDPEYRVPGIARVDHRRLAGALQRFGSIEKLLASTAPAPEGRN